MKWIIIALLIGLPAMYFFTHHGNTFTESDVKVIHKWDVPPVLVEISGIAWMANNRFACIQDEDGIIFIYNTATSSIERQISFAGPGDFEGLTLVGDIAYAMRSDGRIFEINDINSKLPVVHEYKTHLVEENNVEGLTYDKANNRLLAAIKGAEIHGGAYKGIYAFDLVSKTMSETPVYKIDFADKVFKGSKAKKAHKIIQPSEIAVNPLNGDVLISDAISPKLIRLNKSGNITGLFRMASHEFAQAEGITFSPGGKLYIANEGKTEPGNILEVQLND